MEKLINMRLSWYLEHNLLLSPTQFGFRKNKSCANNLAILATEVWTGFANRQITAGLFLDLKGVFPSVMPSILAEDLCELGIPKSITRFIYNSVAHKQLFYKVNGEIIGPRINTIRVPQGSVLSPALYSLYTRKLVSNIPNNCILAEFADDIAILCRSENPIECVAILQNCLNIISRFLSDINLDLCPEKAKLVLFNRLRLDVNNINLSLNLNNDSVYPSDSVKFLGVIFDYKFNFDEHLQYLANKARKILNILKVLRGTWWGADPTVLLNVYRSLFRSPFDYGSHTYTFQRYKFFHKMEKIRNQALRLALGYRRSTLINVMLGEACEPPLRKRFCYLAKRYLIKTFANIDHLIPDSLRNLWEITHQRNTCQIRNTFTLIIAFQKVKEFKPLIRRVFFHPYYEFPYNDHLFTPQVDLKISKTIQLSVSPIEVFKDLMQHKFQNYASFFTDGSKMDSDSEFATGCSSVCTSHNFFNSWKLPNHASIFSTEAIAILYTLDFILTQNFQHSVIYSDSLSVLQSIVSVNPINIKNNLIFLIRNRLSTLSNLNKEVWLIWIPGYRGISGNERADEIAKEAAINGDLLNIALPFSDFYTRPKIELTKTCNEFF